MVSNGASCSHPRTGSGKTLHSSWKKTPPPPTTLSRRHRPTAKRTRKRVERLPPQDLKKRPPTPLPLPLPPPPPPAGFQMVTVRNLTTKRPTRKSPAASINRATFQPKSLPPRNQSDIFVQFVDSRQLTLVSSVAPDIAPCRAKTLTETHDA